MYDLGIHVTCLEIYGVISSFLCTIYTSYHEQIVRMDRTLIFVAGNNESVSKQKSRTGINFISLNIFLPSGAVHSVPGAKYP